MKINPWGALLIAIALAIMVGGILFWHWLAWQVYGNYGFVGLIVGILLAALLIWFLRWREDKNQNGRAV